MNTPDKQTPEQETEQDAPVKQAPEQEMEQDAPVKQSKRKFEEEEWEDDPEDSRKRKYDYFDKDIRGSPLRVEWRHELRSIQRQLLKSDDLETVDQLRIQVSLFLQLQWMPSNNK